MHRRGIGCHRWLTGWIESCCTVASTTRFQGRAGVIRIGPGTVQRRREIDETWRQRVKIAASVLLACLAVAAVLAVVSPDVRDAMAWGWVVVADNAAAYERYLAVRPDGRHASEARRRLDDFAWDDARRTATVVSHQAYLERFPEGRHASEARRRLDDFAWDDARRTATVVSHQAYLERFPEGGHAQRGNRGDAQSPSRRASLHGIGGEHGPDGVRNVPGALPRPYARAGRQTGRPRHAGRARHRRPDRRGRPRGRNRGQRHSGSGAPAAAPHAASAGGPPSGRHVLRVPAPLHKEHGGDRRPHCPAHVGRPGQPSRLRRPAPTVPGTSPATATASRSPARRIRRICGV